MKIIYFVLLSFVAQLSFAQCDDSLSFTDSDKESFVRIHLSIKKDKPQSQDALLYDLIARHKISPQQFQEIQHPNKTQRTLTDNEKVFASELQELKEKYESEIKSIEEIKCKELDLDYKRYLGIQHQYKSCMRFQRSLSAYFNKWMK